MRNFRIDQCGFGGGLERCAEQLASENWEMEKIDPLMSTFEKPLVLHLLNFDTMAPISRFPVIFRLLTLLHSALATFRAMRM